MNYLNEVLKNKDKIISDMIEFLKIESVLVDNPDNKDAPFGEGIRDSLLYILNLAEKMGFKTKNIDNIAGHVEYGEGKEILAILCHVDVVPADGNWKYPPFNAHVADGKIYARGAIDDKGPTICTLYALKILKDLNFIPNKRIRLIIGTDEETKWRGIKRYLECEEMPTLGFSPDADFPLIYGEKGIMSLNLCSDINDEKIISFKAGTRLNVVPSEAYFTTTRNLKNEFMTYCAKYNFKNEIKEDKGVIQYKLYGKSAHAMEPEKGINAAIKLSQFISCYFDNQAINFITSKLNNSRLKDLDLAFTDKEMGALTVNVGIVNFENGCGKIGLNFRYPINWLKDKFLKQFENEALSYNLTVEKLEDKMPHYVDKDDELVKTLHNAYIEYTNDTKTPIKTIGGGTYARALKKAVAFGILFPGREDVVHQENEHIIIDDVIKATAIFAKAINDLGSI